MDSKLKEACDKIRDLSGDISDTLQGSFGPGCELTYRGTLLYELLEAALVLQHHVLSQESAPESVPLELDTPEFHAKWQEWLKHRRQERQPVNDRWKQRWLKKYAQYGPGACISAIDDSMTQGWKSAWPDRYQTVSGSVMKAMDDWAEGL